MNMNKCLLILLLFFPLNMTYANHDYKETGVFFCTTDLSPDVYSRLQQMYEYGTDAAVISSAVSVASLGSYTIYKGHPIVGSGLILAAGAGALTATHISSSYFSELFKNIKKEIKDKIASSLASSTSLSNPNQRYVSIQKKSLDNKEGEISSYKHCSILTAEYASISIENNDFVVVGDAEEAQETHNLLKIYTIFTILRGSQLFNWAFL